MTSPSASYSSKTKLSGCFNPSNDDRLITRKIQFALATIDVQLIDHIVVGDICFSMADNGWIKSIYEEFEGVAGQLVWASAPEDVKQ